MIGSLDPAVAIYADAVRSLDLTISQTRSGWDDTARLAFDRQHTGPLLADARHAATELSRLAQELNAATRLLMDSALSHEGAADASAGLTAWAETTSDPVEVERYRQTWDHLTRDSVPLVTYVVHPDMASHVFEIAPSPASRSRARQPRR